MLHCLLTVLFLLDFIKTPSAVSSGMVEEVVEEEMEEEGNGRKAIDLAGERKEYGWTQGLTRRVWAAIAVSCRRDI